MAGSLFLAEERFPGFFGTETTEEKLAEVEDYLYLVSEQLSYTMRNLDARNFNPTGLSEITEPVYAHIADTAGTLRTEIEATAGRVLAEVAAGYETKTAAAGILMSAEAYTDAAVGNLTLYVNDSRGRSSISLTGGTIELNTNITEVNSVLHIGGNGSRNAGEIRLNHWCRIYADRYEDLILQAGDGDISLSCDHDITMHPTGEVQIHVGTANCYWLIDSTGIYWCNSDGSVRKQVVLE